MENKSIPIIGKECKVFELQLSCDCGGNFVVITETITDGKRIDGEYCILHTCTKCGKSIYVADTYPKHTFRPFGEPIYFGELKIEVK